MGTILLWVALIVFLGCVVILVAARIMRNKKPHADAQDNWNINVRGDLRGEKITDAVRALGIYILTSGMALRENSLVYRDGMILNEDHNFRSGCPPKILQDLGNNKITIHIFPKIKEINLRRC